MTRRERNLIAMGRVLNPSQEEINKILSKSIIDDHSGKKITPNGVIVLEDGQVALYVADSHFCINPISKDEEGIYHLDICSIGGCIRKNPSLKDQINEYNKIVSNKIISVHTLTETIKF